MLLMWWEWVTPGSTERILFCHWSCFDMACDGSTLPGVTFLKENKSCRVFSERITFYEHNSLLALELHVVGDQPEPGSTGQSALTLVHHNARCGEDRLGWERRVG